MNNITVGVDLAKDVIQVCVFSQQKIISNSEMNVNDFALWLVKAKPSRVIFEACGTSNYWKQKATESKMIGMMHLQLSKLHCYLILNSFKVRRYNNSNYKR